MKTKKLKLSDIKVESFITSEKKDGIQGGNVTQLCITQANCTAYSESTCALDRLSIKGPHCDYLNTDIQTLENTGIVKCLKTKYLESACNFTMGTCGTN